MWSGARLLLAHFYLEMLVEGSEAVVCSVLSGECLWSGVRKPPAHSYVVKLVEGSEVVACSLLSG